MIFQDLKKQHSPLPVQELALRSIEKTFSVNVTIHDVHEKFGIIDPKSPFYGRHLHHCECCYRGRANESGWNSRCIRECFKETENHGSRCHVPFLKECWAGLRELVVPVIYDDVHQLSLLAGVFKGKNKPGEKMPQWFRESYRKLPELDEEKLAGLASVLQIFGTGLVKEWEKISFPGNDRLAKIRHFISTHAHEKITVEDLGHELFISGSRARHLVSELSGKSFSELLSGERMKRAHNLLLYSGYSLSEIAEASGFSNVQYFCRQFSEYYGMPPGKYRKKHTAIS